MEASNSRWQKDMCPFPPVRALKPQPAVEQPTLGRHWNSPRRDTPCPKTKMNPHEW